MCRQKANKNSKKENEKVLTWKKKWSNLRIWWNTVVTSANLGKSDVRREKDAPGQEHSPSCLFCLLSATILKSTLYKLHV